MSWIRGRAESENTHRFNQNNTKNIKLENARPWWNTWFLVKKIHPYSRQTSTRNEQMPTRSTHTRMDEQRKNHIGPERPLQRNRHKQQETINLPMMWKILTTQIREEIYFSLTSCGLLSEEQKGFRGTGKLLNFD